MVHRTIINEISHRLGEPSCSINRFRRTTEFPFSFRRISSTDCEYAPRSLCYSSVGCSVFSREFFFSRTYLMGER
jgi:hypothetical protein